MKLSRREFLTRLGIYSGIGIIGYGLNKFKPPSLIKDVENLHNYYSGSTGELFIDNKLLVIPPYQVGLTSPENLETALIVYTTYNRTKKNKKGKLRFKDKINVQKIEEKEVEGYVWHYYHLKNLQPGSEYRYEITNSPFLGKISTFPTNPEKFSFLVTSDTQNWDGTEYYDKLSLSLIKHMLLEKNTKFVINGGDVTQEGTTTELMKHFHKNFHKLFLDMPFYAVKGNHDYRGRSFDDALGFNVKIPGIPIQDNRSVNYSFDYGNVHFTFLDTNIRHRLNNQYIARKFLKKDLDEKKLNLVFYHHPFEINVEDLPVDAVFTGHLHTYKRFKNKNNIPHIIMGGFSKLFPYEMDPWSASFEGLENILNYHANHYLILDVEKNKAFVKMKDKYGDVRDSFVIEKVR